MKKATRDIFFVAILSVFSLLIFYSSAKARQGEQPGNEKIIPDSEEFPMAEENEKCFTCHGEEYFLLKDQDLGVEKRRLMAPQYKIHRADFYQANHRSFACTDCHAYDFEEFPHPVSVRLEEPYACMDCHGYDENYAQYHFEEIDEEFQTSTHASIDGFTCWKCHNAHTYKINIRTTTNLNETILYDNNICLECHAKPENFMLLTDREEMNIVDKHEWLPNQVAHFSSVRCIECHTSINDSILVAHDLRPSEEAVRKCTECHSSDSRLMSTLYKFDSKERRKNGFVNAVILNESYVIGANRNIYLNIGSFIIFAGILLVIGVHILFRVFKK